MASGKGWTPAVQAPNLGRKTDTRRETIPETKGYRIETRRTQ